MKAIPFRCSERQKGQGNLSRSSMDLVGFVDFRPLAEAGIDGSMHVLGFFGYLNGPFLMQKRRQLRPRGPSKISCRTNGVVDGNSVERYIVLYAR